MKALDGSSLARIAACALAVAGASCSSSKSPEKVPPFRPTAILVSAGSSAVEDKIASRMQTRFDVIRKDASLPLDADTARANVIVVGPTVGAAGATPYADLSVPIVAVGGAAWSSQNLVDTRPPGTLNGSVIDYDPAAPPRATIVEAPLPGAPLVDPHAGEIGAGLTSGARPCPDAANVTQVAKPPMARSILSLAAIAPSANPQTLAFVYEEGAGALDDFTTPERRVGLPACRDGSGSPLVYTAAGWSLFDAALAWAVPPIYAATTYTNAPPVGTNVLLPEQDPAFGYALVHRDFLELVYSSKTAAPPTPGRVLVGGAMNGYLRTAAAVTPTGPSTYRVDTTPATLADLFPNGNVDLSLPAADSPGAALHTLNEGERTGQSASAITGSNVVVSFPLALGSVCSASIAAQVQVAPKVSLAFTPNVSLVLDGGTVKSAVIQATLAGSAGIEVTVSGAVNGSCSATFSNIPAIQWDERHVFTVGNVPVPVVIEHEVRPIIHLDATANVSAGSFTASAQGDAALTFGANYDGQQWNGVWNPSLKTSAGVTVQGPGAATARLAANVTLAWSMKLYGVAGPRLSVSLLPSATFGVDPSTCEWTATADFSMEGELGITVSNCVGGIPVDQAAVEASFNKHFGTLGGNERDIALDWYTRSYCAGDVSLGRFPEYTQTGLPYLNVPTGWTANVNAAWVQGNADAAGTFVLATDDRYVVASAPGYSVPPGRSRALWGDMTKDPVTGQPIPPVPCGQRTVTADELDQLKRASNYYQIVYPGPLGMPQGSCRCTAGPSDPCTFGPTSDLPTVVPPQTVNTFFKYLKSAHLKFPIYTAPTASTSGPTGYDCPDAEPIDAGPMDDGPTDESTDAACFGQADAGMGLTGGISDNGAAGNQLCPLASAGDVANAFGLAGVAGPTIVQSSTASPVQGITLEAASCEYKSASTPLAAMISYEVSTPVPGAIQGIVSTAKSALAGVPGCTVTDLPGVGQTAFLATCGPICGSGAMERILGIGVKETTYLQIASTGANEAQEVALANGIMGKL
jgi:hypothetical protein